MVILRSLERVKMTLIWTLYLTKSVFLCIHPFFKPLDSKWKVYFRCFKFFKITMTTSTRKKPCFLFLNNLKGKGTSVVCLLITLGQFRLSYIGFRIVWLGPPQMNNYPPLFSIFSKIGGTGGGTVFSCFFNDQSMFWCSDPNWRKAQNLLNLFVEHVGNMPILVRRISLFYHWTNKLKNVKYLGNSSGFSTIIWGLRLC